MYSTPLSPLSVWVLAMLADGPSHAYGICDQIAMRSLMHLVPNRNSVRSVVKLLERDKLVELFERAPGSGSPNDRMVYQITPLGWRALKMERYRMKLAGQAIDRVLARRVLRG